MVNITKNSVASERARKELPRLHHIFDKQKGEGYTLLLKAPFAYGNGQSNEWMWVEVTQWSNDKITGILQNDAYYVPDLKTGSIVHINEDEVFDYILNKPDGSTEGNETGEILERQPAITPYSSKSSSNHRPLNPLHLNPEF